MTFYHVRWILSTRAARLPLCTAANYRYIAEMAKRILFTALLVLGSCLFAAGSTLSDSKTSPALRTERDVRNLCENALSHIVEGDPAQGISMLRPYATGISKEDVDSLENQLLGQAGTIKQSYGEAIGYVLISEEDLSDTILKAVYVVKYERHLIRWTFIFYKPYDSWILDYFNYDDRIEALFSPKASEPSK